MVPRAIFNWSHPPKLYVPAISYCCVAIGLAMFPCCRCLHPLPCRWSNALFCSLTFQCWKEIILSCATAHDESWSTTDDRRKFSAVRSDCKANSDQISLVDVSRNSTADWVFEEKFPLSFLRSFLRLNAKFNLIGIWSVDQFPERKTSQLELLSHYKHESSTHFLDVEKETFPGKSSLLRPRNFHRSFWMIGNLCVQEIERFDLSHDFVFFIVLALNFALCWCHCFHTLSFPRCGGSNRKGNINFPSFPRLPIISVTFSSSVL